ncbi:hypothetical protein FXO38_11009 [Capsicum annuum]|nr:hypothetical protein FXO38_11009 [Capsicum annuum]
MQSYIVSKKVVVPDFKRVDKMKKLVGQHDSDSDFEELLRSLLLAKTKNNRDDLFIFNINGKDLHFGKRKFSVVSVLKCFKKSDFVFDPKVRNKLMDRYYPGMDKVMRFVFYDDFDFVNKKIAFRDEDLYEIGLVYFIGRFLHSELPRTFIKKADFDLVESSHYLKYDWGGECFQVLKKSCSHKMKKNPSSFHFQGFHLALQIWFYECCSDIDKCVAHRIGSQTPRILNWESSEELIFYDYLQSTMFKRYNNEYVFSDIVFTDEEELKFNLGAIHQDSLGHEHRNDLDHSVLPITEDAFSVLKNEIANVDSQFNGMREFVEEFVKLILNELRFVKQQSSEFVEKENVDVGLQTPPASKKQNEVLVEPVIEKYSFRGDVSVPLDVVNNPVNDQSRFDDIPFFIESQLVAPEPTFRELKTPKAHITTPIMFDKSPVGAYNQSDTSSRRCPLYFKRKHPF